MPRKDVHLRLEELKTDLTEIKGLEIAIGRIIEEEWAEPMGPTPYPSVTTLREWDQKLLKKYKPMYLPYCDSCCLCTMGKCDLTRGKRGACGLDMSSQQSRIVLLAASMGSATHTSHARHLVEHLINKYGTDFPLDVGKSVGIEVEAPLIRLVCGVRPRTLGDLEPVLGYLESQITQLLAATHTGQEGNALDFESKVFHAGMLDLVGMEVADIAQISALGLPKADPEAPLAEIGAGTVDLTKPTILVIGHNVPSAVEIIDHLDKSGLQDKVEVTGICCTAHDLTRYDQRAKIIGPISWQLRYIRSGIPDVIVDDEQCIRSDVLVEAQKTRTPVIASSEKNCLGLRDRTDHEAGEIVADLVNGKDPGALLLDPAKVGEVAVRVAVGIAPQRTRFKAVPDIAETVKEAKRCTQCNDCRRACPNNMPIPEAINEAARGNINKLADLYDVCIGCDRCESACPNHIRVHTAIARAAEGKLRGERSKIRVGRGAIQDVEIRNVGAPIVLGEIPGVIALVGCANYPRGGREVAEIAHEFIKRRYIVVSSGCSAMSIAVEKDSEGKSLYEAYPGTFEAGGLINVGSCVSNAHIAGAAIKIANIFAKRSLRANYEEIADYIHNRVGAVGLAWGAITQKAASIASGFWRLGVPVVVGPHGSKYRRMLLGRRDKEEDWYVYDARTGGQVYTGPAPEHLFCTAETKEEAMVMMAKLCLRPNDTTKGRMIKLSNYIDMHRKFYGVMPDDLQQYVRRESEIPITMKDEIIKILKESNWQERPTPDPTLLLRMIGVRKAK